MKTERKPFMPLDPEIVDDRLEQLAATKGVGKFEKPPATAGEGEGAAKPAAAARTAEAQPSPVPREEMCRINFEAPAYLSTALKIRAATEQTSVRHVILKALREAGFEVRDSDMIDAEKRLRGSNR